MLSRPIILPVIPRSLLFVVGLIFASAVFLNGGGVSPSLAGALLPFSEARLVLTLPDALLANPVRGVKVHQIADTWHAARSGERRHEGQDIFAPRGTPVLSATEGMVIRVGENTLGGHTVSVLGAGGRVYYYAHLDHYADGLSLGKEVTTETVLGYVGTSGNARGTPPHLHFGIYSPEGAVNPLPLLTDRAGNRSIKPSESF